MKLSNMRLVLLVALALLAFGCNGKRVAIVNTDLVYKDSLLSEKGTEYLRNLSNEMQEEFTAAQQKAESAKDKKAAQAEMQQTLVDLQQRLNAEQQMVITQLSEAYKKAMDSVRAKHKVDVIIPSEVALSYDPASDLTKAVLDEMNTIPVEFKPVSEAPAENAPEAAPAQ